jgi:hypothetical protein
MSISLSVNERLILRNQYQILSYLDPDVQNKEWYERSIEILEYGYEINYKDLFLGADCSLDSNKSLFVIKVLNMYDRIAEATEDKDATPPKDADYFASFHGFDGNGESEYIGYARFLIHKEGKFQRFRNLDLNSHLPSVAKYKKMLSIFDNLPGNGKYGDLTESDLRKLLTA